MVPRLVDFAGGEGFGYFAHNEGPREGPNRIRMFPGVDVAGVASLGIRGKRWAWRGLTYPGLLPQQFCLTWEKAVRTLLLEAVYVGTNSKRWWRSELLRQSVGAGEKPAGSRVP